MGIYSPTIKRTPQPPQLNQATRACNFHVMNSEVSSIHALICVYTSCESIVYASFDLRTEGTQYTTVFFSLSLSYPLGFVHQVSDIVSKSYILEKPSRKITCVEMRIYLVYSAGLISPVPDAETQLPILHFSCTNVDFFISNQSHPRSDQVNGTHSPINRSATAEREAVQRQAPCLLRKFNENNAAKLVQ